MNIDWLKIFSRANITLGIAILGAVLSVYNLVVSIVQNRFKIHVTLKRYAPCPEAFEEKPFVFVMSIMNCSRTGVSISRIQLKHGDQLFDFESVPHRAYHWSRRIGKKVEDEIYVDSLPLPQYIPGMGIIGDFFMVNTAPETPNDLTGWESP